MIINVLILLIAVFVVFLTLIRPKWGVLLMLCCYLLMPEMPIDIGVNLKKNHVLMLVVVTFFIMRYIKRQSIQYYPFMFCIVYLVFSLLSIPFKDLSFSIQLYYLIYDIAIILLFPIVIWNLLIDENCINYYRSALLACITIALVYGLFLMTTEGVNPWVMLFSLLQGGSEISWLHYYSDENRLFGRISSVFFHPMHYAAFIGFSTLYIIYIKDKLPKNFFVFICAILMINMVACGVRSVIGALIVTLIVFLFLKRDVRIALGGLAYVLIALVVVLSIPGVDTYITSIFSKPEDSSVGGSSIGMRLEQLEGAFDEIRNNILFGRGYGWSRDYIVQNENHPILLGFESIIFVVLCNNGILGVLLLVAFGILYCLYVNKNVVETDRAFFISLLVYYISYECITGEFAFQFFMLFYTFMLYEHYETHYLQTSIIKDDE